MQPLPKPKTSKRLSHPPASGALRSSASLPRLSEAGLAALPRHASGPNEHCPLVGRIIRDPPIERLKPKSLYRPMRTIGPTRT